VGRRRRAKTERLRLRSSISAQAQFQCVFHAIRYRRRVDQRLLRAGSETFPGAPFGDLLAANNVRLRLSLSGGANIGKLRAQATLFHTGGYDLNPAVGVAPAQTHVSSFDVVNLFFRYDFRGQGAFKDLGLTLNLDKVLNRDPPVYRSNNIVPANDGYINGNTVGRLATLGSGKKF
jgi:iron complex outermembrane recepter protein